MGRGVALWMGCAALLLGVSAARAERTLSEDELRDEMARNRALDTYVARNGMPDVAERHFLADRPPWDDHEVTVYYLDRRTELGFARAYVLGRPDVEVMRYERPMTDAQVAALASQPKLAREGARTAAVTRPGGPAERAEAAARRAEDAANRVEAAVAPVEKAARRAEVAAAHIERGFHQALRK